MKQVDLPPTSSQSSIVNRNIYHNLKTRANTNESMTGMMLQSRMSRNKAGEMVTGSLSESKINGNGN
jgi:hypothetical protein